MSRAGADLRQAVTALMPQVRADLAELVRIPSVAFPDHDREPVLRCARTCAELLAAAGAQVELVASAGGIPTVTATVPGPPGAGTVLLYSHYDVQPGGDPASWATPPFEPAERDGRLYGRGAADDKSGVVTHIAAIRAFRGRPPVTLRVVLEGEEEFGGDFEEWPTTRPETFAGLTAAVVNDMGPAELGLPTFTTALRGIVAGIVSVRTLAEPVHSGLFGGPAPDALMVLIKLLSSLVDDAGDCTVAGLGGAPWHGAEPPEDRFRRFAGVAPGVPLVGTGSLGTRLYTRPSATVIGIDAPPVDGAANVLVPAARATISVRIPPGVAAADAERALREHVVHHAPWGVAVDYEPLTAAAGTLLPTDGPAFDAYTRAMTAAYGRAPVRQGVGGAVPFVANLHREFPEVEILAIGAQDPAARIHGPDESIDLAELERSILAQVLFLAEVAARDTAS